MTIANNSANSAYYEIDPLSAFSKRGVDYAKYRPTYPPNVIDTILRELGEPSQLAAADVGAGTGIASRLLAERGIHVWAIEPNTSMRSAAQNHPLVKFCDASAEHTHLPTASVDLITSFQAFHWFNPQPTLAEFHRILKPSGRLAIVWNQRAADDEFSVEFDRIVKAAMSELPAPQPQNSVGRLLMSSSHFGRVRRHTFTYKHELDLVGTIGYALSKSFVPQEGAAHRQLLVDLQELHARWADERGMVSFVYHTTLYLAQPQHGLNKLRRLFSNWLIAK
ncbi:class I SAM-dependent methyltransferase [Chroococcidiopsis sp.]|uniref:class I SAM-dependent methyltransferase n=1 Tax=Chroococcidiopsis sp. TaxID=3088168 RepID=UPI003F2EB71F